MMDEDFDIRQEQLSSGEKEFENALRPLAFNDFSGQQQVVENLEVFVEAAKYRGEPLDHVLLHGPQDWARRRCRILLPTNWE